MPIGKKRILVINDDGPKSPLVAPFLDALGEQPWCGELRFVFPAEEQSWISQSTSRFRPIYTSSHQINGRSGFLASGTPADCAGLGLHHLYPDAADFVFSGINLGTNATLPFYLASGTVGGARQAMCFGARAIAFSTLVPEDLFRACREEDWAAMKAHTEDWRRISRICAALGEKFCDPSVWNGVDVFTVNVPWAVTDRTEVVITSLEKGTYLPLYTAGEKNRFAHHFQGFRRGEGTGGLPSDLKTIEAGKISLTPLCYDLGPKDKSIAAALAQLFNSELSVT